jgi:hypothetical protein
MLPIVLLPRPGVIRPAAQVVREPIDPVEYRLPASPTSGQARHHAT